MASPPLTLRRRSILGSSEGIDRDRGSWLVPAFVIASVGAHALVWIVLATLPSGGIALAFADATIEFELAPLPDPEPEPEPAIVPEPEPEPEPLPVVRAADPTPAPSIEPPPAIPEDVGVHSVEDGLAVDAVEAVGDGGGALAARPVARASAGVPGGTGEGVAPAPERQAVDHRRLAREWMLEVNRTVMRRAVRDYPRAARRSQLEGTVVVSIAVDANGQITSVEVQRGAGSDTLDHAAIAAVQAVGALPPPPDIFNRRGRPLTMPIAYRLR